MTVRAGGINAPLTAQCIPATVRAYVLILHENIRVFPWPRLSREPARCLLSYLVS
jgi:hypothetical protein